MIGKLSQGMGRLRNHWGLLLVAGLVSLAAASSAHASEASLAIPDLWKHGSFTIFGQTIRAGVLLLVGSLVICGTLSISLYQLYQIKKQPAHRSMLNVAEIIFQTCKTYLIQQGKFLLMLFAIIAVAISYYLLAFGSEAEAGHQAINPIVTVVLVLLFAVVGMGGSYAVAWYGIRVNTYANARTAFASLKGQPWDVVNIPLRSGMSVGLFLISLELVMMVFILLAVPREIVGFCFLGFAIGESLGASALRIAGGIFTKIADIGSDLMKIVFKVKEDDPRNPGVIADCTGDNAGDSVGPTADGFETYGVTGVALISFILLAVPKEVDQVKLLVWIFVMRLVMVIASGLAYMINDVVAKGRYSQLRKMNFETPLKTLVWLASIISIVCTYIASYMLIHDLEGGLWWKLASVITCGTLAGAIIPEVTTFFTSVHSTHVKEVVTSSREGGASLNVLSGLTAGNYSAFWIGGVVIVGLMAAAYGISTGFPASFMLAPAVFAFGLVAFGFLGMGPVTIAVDSYGPVTDNAQSVYELSLIETQPNIRQDLKANFNIDPDFEHAKLLLEENDGAGNTFKATAKPVLIGTAVVGATTMIFSIIIVLAQSGMGAGAAVTPAALDNVAGTLSILNAPFFLGLIGGAAVVYWFVGASTQAVITGAYRAVAFIKRNMRLDEGSTKATTEDSKRVVEICTKYAQAGMFNIFLTIFFLTLAAAFVAPPFFIGYLIGLAITGLFQAIFMANAGGAWDNAKKIVEVELKQKGTELHAATVVGDTVGDPFKDTSSVALNPIIKFTTLFGLLAVELAVSLSRSLSGALAAVFLVVALVFVYRSFYGMRIETGR
jgi:K(+)-stimulated pyrophosphate-energized sodium pump